MQVRSEGQNTQSLEATARQLCKSRGGRWSGSKGMARCPAHDDRTPSLGVTLGRRAILFHCFPVRLVVFDKAVDDQPVVTAETDDLSDLAELIARLPPRARDIPEIPVLTARPVTGTLRKSAKARPAAPFATLKEKAAENEETSGRPEDASDQLTEKAA